jgi:hypothetical protein
MGSGYRDAFAEYIDDDLGDFDDSFSTLRSMAPRRSRRKAKKNRAMGSRTHKKRIKHASRRSPRSRSRPRARHSKRKGMSKEFLRQLRKKHGLGEFKRR